MAMMTKRFVFDPSIYHFTDTQTGKTYCEYNLDKVVDMLNNYEEGKRNLNEINGILNATADNLIAENTHLMELHKFDEETIKKLKKDKEALLKQLNKLHIQISELAIGLENKSKEHKENDFKLHTLEKWYTCPRCAFNSKEFEYLRSLKKDQ